MGPRVLINGIWYKPGQNPYEQLDKLVSTSTGAGFEPLYCFFNFPFPDGQFNGPNLCKHRYRAPTFWGCSLAFPDQVKNMQSTQLTKLRPIMYPLVVFRDLRD